MTKINESQILRKYADLLTEASKRDVVEIEQMTELIDMCNKVIKAIQRKDYKVARSIKYDISVLGASLDPDLEYRAEPIGANG